MPVRWLAGLSALVTGGTPPEEAVRLAPSLVRDGLGASEAFLIYGDGASFGRYATCDELALTDTALWIVHHDLTTRCAPCAFNVRDGRVVDFRNATARQPAEYIAALIPMASAGEMLVVRGPWGRGIGTAREQALSAALPTLALIMERRLDARRAERQREQLTALANITRVFSESAELDTVLTAIAGTIATVTGIDYISIDITNSDGSVKLRSFNTSRPGTEELRERWKRGATRPDPVRDEVMRTRQPMLFQDCQNDERIPERGRTFFMNALMRSTGVLPLLAKDDVLGVLSVASHTPLTFATEQVELLEGLAAQVATAVTAIRLYQDLAASRRELQRLNEQLQESMGIQHHLARSDALTGVPNRRYLEEALEAECARAIRYDQPLCVVMADVDDLKTVNDTYSHQRGDNVLRVVAHVARATCRQADMVGRYGGDEFVFVLPSTKLENAVRFAERFRERLINLPRNGVRDPISITVSLGVAEWNKETMAKPACLIARADTAMYAAKAAGRNQTMVAEPEAAHAA